MRAPNPTHPALGWRPAGSPTRTLAEAMPPTRRDTDPAAPSPRAARPRPRRVALGLAGRVAIHAGGHLPHGDALAALGRAAVALGGPWLAAAWTIGALAGSRRARCARRRGGPRPRHRRVVPAHGGRRRPRGRGLRGARRRRLGRRRPRRGRALRPGRRRLARRRRRVRAAAIAALAGALAGEALLLAGAVGGARGGAGAGRRARRGPRAAGRRPPPGAARGSRCAVFAVAAVAFAGDRGRRARHAAPGRLGGPLAALRARAPRARARGPRCAR